MNYKVGDKVWVLCKVIEPCESLMRVTGSGDDNWFWAGREQCRPVEPPVIKDSLTTEPNCPEFPDSSSDPLQVGDAVRFVSPGHGRHGTEGVILSIVKGPNREYHFRSDCGQFHRYCTAAELERVMKRYRTPALSDLVNGPIACEYRDSDKEHWRSGFLVHVLNGNMPFLCVNEEQELSGQWGQCRIEVGMIKSDKAKLSFMGIELELQEPMKIEMLDNDSVFFSSPRANLGRHQEIKVAVEWQPHPIFCVGQRFRIQGMLCKVCEIQNNGTIEFEKIEEAGE